MVIPRHKECDICGREVGVNLRYYTIKSKNIRWEYEGPVTYNRKHHICENCMNHIRNYIQKIEKVKRNE